MTSEKFLHASAKANAIIREKIAKGEFAKPRAKRAPQRLFFIEVTDTFGGEANYSWVTRHIIRATTERGAVNKFSRLSGYEWRGVGCERYDSKSGLTCFFLSAYEADQHGQYSSYGTDDRTDAEKESEEKANREALERHAQDLENRGNDE